MNRLFHRSGCGLAPMALLLLCSNAGLAASGVLHAFTTASAENPAGGVVRDASSNLYGTTVYG